MTMKNQRGFTLVELTVGLGLMGVISLVTMKMISQQQSNTAYLTAKTEINKTVSLVQSSMNKPENCKFMLAGNTVAPSLGSAASIPSLRITGPSRDGSQIIMSLLDAGLNYGHFYLGPDAIKLISNPALPNSAELVLTFNLPTKSLLNFGATTPRPIVKRIPVQVVTNAANVVRSCGVVVSDANNEAKKRFCLSLAAKGITTWTADNKCQLKSLECLGGRVPRTISNIGALSSDPSNPGANGNCVTPDKVIDADLVFDTTANCKIKAGGIMIVRGPSNKITVSCPP
jgi:prepilin-type N-terminal cleavage/methylation domain-containing protein